jgi:uncharacterized protein (TIGR03435 family)
VVRTLILAGLLALMAAPTGAQSPSTAPRFQVASVRMAPTSGPIPDDFSANPQIAGERFSWTTNLHSLVRYAYRLPNWRVTGLPPISPFYRIGASMDAAASPEDVRAMLRQLLIDRFKLATHTMVEERAGYAMVVADRPKLQKAAANGAAQPLPDYLKGKSAAAFEGFLFVSMEGIGTSALTGRGVTLTRLAETLEGQFKEFVVDETGLTGNYYFGFTFRNLDSPDGAVESAPLPDALREQLGLRLERRKGPVELLVVDHFERTPSEN